MKTKLLIVTVLWASLFSGISLAESFDFRKARWGMSMEQVTASEPLEVSASSDEALLYKSQVIGKDVNIVYSFVKDQLVQARYMMAEVHTNKNDYIADYNSFSEILKKKYGKPTQDKTYWRNKLYEDDSEHWGFAVSLGHLVQVSHWNTDKTEIDNILMGENYEITCVVQYSSKNLKGIAANAEEKKALDAF